MANSNGLKFSIQAKLGITLGVLVVGFSLFGIASLGAMSKLNVNGPIYQRIVQGKDLIADILPPPEYILESYLVILQLTNTVNADEIDALIKRLQVLKNDYDTRHVYWQNQELEPDVNQLLLEQSYDSAKAFYTEAQQNFIPSVQKNDVEATKTSLTKLSVYYEKHRQAIDTAVQNITKHNTLEEENAQSLLNIYDLGLIAIFIFSIMITSLMMWRVSVGIVKSLKSTREIARSIAIGNLNSTIDISKDDEIGDLLREMNTMQQAINAFVMAQEAMATQHNNGFIQAKLDTTKFEGTYAQMAHQVNALVQSRIAVTQQVLSIISQYAKGDFSADMESLPGETQIITQTVNSIKSALLAINNEIELLAKAGANGDFSKRANANAFDFMFHNMLNDLNLLLSTCDNGFNDILRVSNALAQGDLTKKISNTYPGTFGKVQEGINSTVENLQALISEIKQSTHQINTTAQEIAEWNNDLSNRTEKQAASLEETASSMTELTSTVQHNAENAKQANELAKDAAEIANQGGVVVGSVVTMMDDINDSSRKVVEIISVIDNIAFQTNILALNAAVEAARAGEQGRGFAVVATEVRNLAQRAAAAAGEIKGLISNSVEKVEEGSQLVERAGKTMREILNSVQGVTGIMQEITAASLEQSMGIAQVNNAITQMDEVTQQNAALVEQAASGAESLEDQAKNLSVVVANFKT
jgi:methyl-accepting chemotaxis protein